MMNVNLHTIKKILVIRYRSIGDILLANPTLEAIRRKFANAEIHMLVDDHFAPLLDGNPNINKVVTLVRGDRPGRHRSERQFIRRIRAAKYDMTIDLQGGPRGAWLSRFSGAPIRVGHAFRLRNRLCYNVYAGHPGPDDHSWRVQFLVLREFGIDIPQNPRFYLGIHPGDTRSVQKRITAAMLDPTRPVCIVHPGARIDEKRFPAEKMGAVVRWLVEERSANVILAGSAADQQETWKIQEEAGMALPTFTDLSIGELAALIDMSAMLVCNDSGPMHMAGTLDRPTVALFGPSDPKIWSPPGDRNILLTPPPMDCMPCDQKGCSLRGRHCMTRIEVADVTAAIDRLEAL